jgi:hypothetical protein
VLEEGDRPIPMLALVPPGPRRAEGRAEEAEEKEEEKEEEEGEEEKEEEKEEEEKEGSMEGGCVALPVRIPSPPPPSLSAPAFPPVPPVPLPTSGYLAPAGEAPPLPTGDELVPWEGGKRPAPACTWAGGRAV